MAQLVEALRYKPEGRGFDSQWCHSHNLPATLWPWGRLSTRVIFWRLKAAGAYGWQLCHLFVSSVLKSGSLNFLEPSGPVQAGTGLTNRIKIHILCLKKMFLKVLLELLSVPHFADSKRSSNLYDMYHCCVCSEKLLMMDRGTVRNL